MNFLSNGFFGIVFLLFLSGCASVEVYDRNTSIDQADGKWNGKQSGVKFYSPKPYLMVENTGKKDEPVKTSIIYLPNYDEPQYARFKPGYGKADLTLKLNNGMLTEFGGNGESGDIAALLDSVTGGYKTVIDALKVRQETQDARNPDGEDTLQGLDAGDYISASNDLSSLSRNIKNGVATLKASGDLDSSNVVYKTSEFVTGKIDSVSQLLLDKAYITSSSFDVSVILAELGLALKEFEPDGRMIIESKGLDSLTVFSVNANSWNIKLQSVIKMLTPDKAPAESKPAFVLYELTKSGNNLVLRKVNTE